MNVTCQCGRTRTVFFDHIKGVVKAFCNHCDGSFTK